MKNEYRPGDRVEVKMLDGHWCVGVVTGERWNSGRGGYYSVDLAGWCVGVFASVDVRRADDAPHTDGGARALDASEALREARIAGMREALAAFRSVLKEDAWGAPYIDLDDAEGVLDAAIEAVRRGER